MMCGETKVLWFALLPSFVLSLLLVLTADQAYAVPKTRTQCETESLDCINRCDNRKETCDKLPAENVSCEQQQADCSNSCVAGLNNCYRNAVKDADTPKPWKKVVPKDLPKLQQEGTRPKVLPKSNIQQQ